MQPQPRVQHADENEGEGSLIADRFQVEAVLGQGGMGAVYRVHEVSTGRRLAIKRLRARDKPKHQALFEREYHTLAGLAHPHIVEVYDYGRDDAGPYYSMELLEGSDIHDKAPLPWPEVCRVLHEVCWALALLHARGLIHRDVSAKNVWCTPSGHIKLIDFGALCAFGTNHEIAGTPPYLPPEALRAQALDQRSDLYSLGALGYWLLTGLNAYPARSLAELPEAWNYPPRPASERIRELERADLPAPPAELDALLAALLTLDPAGRPDSAAEVMDRLRSVAGLETAATAYVIESHLRSKSFVGRERERRQVERLLARVPTGRGASVVVECGQGFGRTRFLAELALDTRLSGALAIETSAAAHDGAYGVPLDIAFRLLNALPEVARKAAKPFAPTLAHLGPTLKERLGVPTQGLAAIPQTPGEARMRLQSALQDWILAVSRERSLALFIDDVQDLDEASLAWLAGLSHRAQTHPLLVVSALRVEKDRAYGAALSSLRLAGRPVHLAPLSAEQTALLLRSIFGAVPNIARLTDCLHRLSEGNPDHCLELADHLVRTGVLRHVDGAWVLPQEIDEKRLPTSRSARVAAQLERLSPNARELARVLSIYEGLLSLDLCAALSELDSRERFAMLQELVRQGVLTGSEDGYRFQNSLIQATLRAELEPARAKRAHRNLGEILLQNPELGSVERLRAGHHLILGAESSAGLDASGAAVVTQASIKLAITDHPSVASAVDTLESCLGAFRTAGADKHELLPLLSSLTIAGYYADRRLGLRYGDESIAAFERVLGLRLTRALRPFLGRKLGLYLGLAWAVLGFVLRRKNPCVPSFREAITMLFNTVSTLAGASTICIDADGAARYAQVLEPLTALGKNHAASVIYEFCCCLSGTVRDRLGQAYARWQRLLERVESATPIKDLPDDVRIFYRAGGLYACGVMECWREPSRALEFADRLDGFGLKLYEMSSDQLRMLFHANQGNLELSEVYRAKVELHAIQRGTAWQVETWTPSAMVTAYLRTYDAMRLKQCLEQMREISRNIPSLRLHANRLYGAYLLARGKHEAAISALAPVLEEEPLRVVGWARMHGALARAHNALGQYARAKEVSERALSQLTPCDLAFSAMNLILRIEYAIALAGVGEHARARGLLQEMLTQNEQGQGPLTLGALHEALGRVEAMAGDEAAAAKQYEAMERWYRGTKIASLVERCERVAWQRRAPEDQTSAASTARSADPRYLSTVIHRIRHGGATDSGPQWALEQLAQYAGLQEASVYASESGSALLMACVGGEPPGKDIRVWLESRLGPASTASSVTAQIDNLASLADPNRIQIAGKSYRAITLRIGVGAAERIVGALVIREDQGPIPALPFDLLRAVASRLLDASPDV